MRQPRSVPTFEDLRVIDCDSHLTESPDLWSSRVPDTMRNRVPELRTVDGVTNWYLNDEPWATLGGNVIGADKTKVHGIASLQPFEAIDPSAWRVKDRLELLDEEGIFAQILYPNGIGFSSNHIFSVEDENDRLLILQVYNDFLVDVQEESGGRLFPQAMIPIWDMEHTVAEMTRLLDKGIRGFTLSDKPELLGLPELIDPYFDPMWATFDMSGAVANFHVGAGRSRAETQAVHQRFGFKTGKQEEARPVSLAGGGSTVDPGWHSLPHQRMLAAYFPQARMSNMRIIANLCLSNLFDRFPRLKISSVESAIGWVPFLLESLEYQLGELIHGEQAMNYAKRRPTEYFRDHMTVGFAFERSGPARLIDEIGVNNVLVETDLPHADCLYPGFRARLANVLKDVDPYVQRRVVQDNASELYRIDVTGPVGA